MRIRTHSARETRAVASELASLLVPGDLVVLAGDLGSGKTTFAQGIARGLGVVDPVTSPTFVIVQEYDGRIPLAHVDVYRLELVQELHDLGFEEIVDSGRVTMVEWGDLVEPALPADRLVVALRPLAGDEREIEITACGRRWDARRGRLDDVLAAFVVREGGS